MKMEEILQYPAPPWMVETHMNSGINHLSAGARFLPFTVAMETGPLK